MVYIRSAFTHYIHMYICFYDKERMKCWLHFNGVGVMQQLPGGDGKVNKYVYGRTRGIVIRGLSIYCYYVDVKLTSGKMGGKTVEIAET